MSEYVDWIFRLYVIIMVDKGIIIEQKGFIKHFSFNVTLFLKFKMKWKFLISQSI